MKHCPGDVTDAVWEFRRANFTFMREDVIP